MVDRLTLSARYVVIVEGDSDRAFLQTLINQRGLLDLQVVAPSEVAKDAGGRGAFTRVLNYLPILDGFDRVEAILLVSDNDDDANASFVEVVRAVQGTEEFGEPRRRYPVPINPRQKAQGNPATVVYMIPGLDQPGNLETWCLAAARQTHTALIRCVDDLATCAGLQNWSVTRQAKAKLRSFIAVAHQDRPDISLTKVWEDVPGLFPISSDAFDDLAEFLQRLPQLIAA